MNGLLETFTGRGKLGSRLALLSLMLVAATAITACAALGSGSDDAGAVPAASVQTQGAPREIPVSGSLVFPNSRTLSFESPGIVGEVLVSEGQSVESGQPLAALDAQAIAQLEQAVVRARSRIVATESNLASLRLSQPGSIARAELEVAGAVVALDEAQAALDDLTQSPSINVVGARLLVVQAEVALDDANERLEELLTPKAIAVSAAEQRVAAARVELDNAQEAYDDIKDGSFPDESLRDARNRVAFATTALDAANRNLTDSQIRVQNAITQAEDAESLMRERYVGLFKYWFGTEPTEAELQMTSEQLIDEWGIDLEATFDRFNPDYATQRPPLNDPNTRWNETTIWAWLNLHPQFGIVVPTCSEEDVIGRRELCITRELDNAYDALDRARDSLAEVRSNSDSTAERTLDAITAAEVALTDARDDLEEVEDGPDASVVENAEKRLQLAQANLQESEKDLAELTVDIDPLNIALARAGLAQAEVALEEAQEDLERVLNGGIYVERARKNRDHASAALEAAQQRLADSQTLLDDQISAAEAELQLANTMFAEAQKDLDGAIVRSPIDGIVSLVNVEVDDRVGDELSVIEVVAADVIEVDGVIDAAGRPFVSEGASAVVNIESIGDTPLGGSVSYIDEEARTERGVVSYAVRIRVDVPSGINIPITLSAVSATIMSNDTAMLRHGVNSGEYASRPSASMLP